MAGYYIEGIPGKYGGYRLITQSVIPTVRLNEAEQRALSSGAEYLKSRNDFPYSSDYEKAMGKVFAAVKHEQPQEASQVRQEISRIKRHRRRQICRIIQAQRLQRRKIRKR